MIRKFRLTVLAAVFIGWVFYAFSIFDLGRFSITLLLISSATLAVTSGIRLTDALFKTVICLTVSTLLCWAIALLKYPDAERTFTHLFQSILSIGILIGAASTDWDDFLPPLRKVLVVLVLVVIGYGFYQLVARRLGLPYAFLPMTNLQLGSDEGMQRGYSLVIDGAAFTRISSFFAEPSDLGRFMLWVFALGYACREIKMKLFLMGAGVAGIALSQSMGSIVGLLFFTSVVMILKRDVRGLVLTSIVFIVSFVALSYFAPDEIARVKERAIQVLFHTERYITGTGRFYFMKEHWAVFMKAPFFGYGIASINKIVASDSYVVNAILFVMLERGIFGSVLFFGPFLWAFLTLGLSVSKADEVTQTALYILIMEMFCFSTFAMIYFPPVYLALGFAVSQISKQRYSRPLEKIS